MKFRVTADEQQAIAAAARELGVSAAGFARRMTMRAAGHNAEPVNTEQQLLRDLVAQIQYIGLVCRKRVVRPADAECVVFELRRLQHFVLQSHNSQSPS